MKNHTFQSLRSTIEGARSHKGLPPKYLFQNYHHQEQKKIHKKIPSESPFLQTEKENISMKNKTKNVFQTPIFSKKEYIHNSNKNLLASSNKSAKSIKITSGHTPLKYPVANKIIFHQKEQRKTLDICFKSAIIKPNTENNNCSKLLMTDNTSILKAQKNLYEMEKMEESVGSRLFIKGSRKTLPEKQNSSTPAFLKKIIEKNKKPRQFKFQDFLFLKTIGFGKYGKVNLVMDKETGFICALKIMNKAVIKEEDILGTLIQEIKIQFYLNHPNIVKAYGYFFDTENVYLLLEYCPNGNLEKLIKTVESFQEEELLIIISNIFEAVFYLHCEGILHRDIKPQNIVISNGIYKLCDFGWAAYASGQNRSTFCGTPLYVSPQVLKGNGYNQKADIWGLGILCYELVYGGVPFTMNSPKDMAKIMKDKISFPKPETEISPELINMIKKMLNRDSEERCSINELMSYPLINQFINEEKKELSLYF